jgi:hypothetical protein
MLGEVSEGTKQSAEELLQSVAELTHAAQLSSL